MSAEPTLRPGLVDAHVHRYMEATADPARRQLQLHTPYAERRPVLEHALQSLARAGVVEVRDGGDYGGFAWRSTAHIAVPGPREQLFTDPAPTVTRLVPSA